METQPVRIGIAGAGGISASWSRAILDLPDLCRLTAVADPVSERAESLAAQHPAASVFSSVRQMQLESELDAVIISTPPAFHCEQSCQFLEQGVHVLCEKPLAITVEDAVRMVETSRAHKALFTMASKFRFVPDMIEARRMVQSGAIGEILLFENQFTGLVDMSQRWNSRPELSGGGVLIDNGTHSLDILRYFLGPVDQVMVVEGKRIQKLPVEDTVHVFARAESGALGSIDLSWSLTKASPWYVNIHGSRGGIQVGWKESLHRLDNATSWTRYGSGYDKTAAFRGQLENFIAAMRGQQTLVITPEEGLESVQAVRAAYAALQNVRWVPVGTS